MTHVKAVLVDRAGISVGQFGIAKQWLTNCAISLNDADAVFKAFITMKVIFATQRRWMFISANSQLNRLVHLLHAWQHREFWSQLDEESSHLALAIDKLEATDADMYWSRTAFFTKRSAWEDKVLSNYISLKGRRLEDI